MQFLYFSCYLLSVKPQTHDLQYSSEPHQLRLSPSKSRVTQGYLYPGITDLLGLKHWIKPPFLQNPTVLRHVSKTVWNDCQEKSISKTSDWLENSSQIVFDVSVFNVMLHALVQFIYNTFPSRMLIFWSIKVSVNMQLCYHGNQECQKRWQVVTCRDKAADGGYARHS